MKKAAIVLDKWKLKIFTRHLDRGSFFYKKRPGITVDTVVLKVQTNDLLKLKAVIEDAQAECARAHLH